MLFSVVTPVLNGMDYLPGCIESVRAQQGGGIEVEHIVVDGGSSDGSAAYAQAHGCRVMGRERPSVTFAINKGLAHARGQFASMLGCDDRLLPGGLERVARTFQAEQRPWIVSACRWLTPDGQSLGVQPAAPGWISASTLSCLGWNCVPHVATFITPQLHHELGDLDEDFTYAPDYELACRLLQTGNQFSRVTDPAVAMLRHNSNMSKQRRPSHLAELERIQTRYGPASPLLRVRNRYALKLWLNAANPDWFLNKRRDPGVEKAARAEPRSRPSANAASR